MNKFAKTIQGKITNTHFNNLHPFLGQYQSALQKDIDKNEIKQHIIKHEIEKIQELMKELELISEKPEWPESFTPINSLAYVPATIIHTSEHYVKLGDESYTLMSLKETLEYLKRKIFSKEDILAGYKIENRQLQERLNVITGNSMETTLETKDMPIEIVSTLGAAVKTNSGFYEIIEPYNEEEEQEFYKRRQVNKDQKRSQKKEESGNDETFINLCELEELENKYDEECQQHEHLFERVKKLLNDSNIYDILKEDDSVFNYCCAQNKDMNMGETSLKTILNNLIVKALTAETPTYNTNVDIS